MSRKFFSLLLMLAMGGCSKRTIVATAGSGLIAARPYQANVPSQIDPARAYPLVVLLHGLGGDGARINRNFGLDALVDSEGFLLAHPDGVEEHTRGRTVRFWNATDLCCAFTDDHPDDVAYLDAVIDDMSARYPVDPKRIFLVGHSNGGFMAHRFACDRASRVAAIVSLAGAMWTDTTRCHPSEPVAVLQIHGDADRTIPYPGGPREDEVASTLVSAHTTVLDWVNFDGCKSEIDRSAPALDLISDEAPALGAETSIERWSGCRGVELWTLRGGSHVPRFQQPTWAKTIYEWLKAHPKP